MAGYRDRRVPLLAAPARRMRWPEWLEQLRRLREVEEDGKGEEEEEDGEEEDGKDGEREDGERPAFTRREGQQGASRLAGDLGLSTAAVPATGGGIRPVFGGQCPGGGHTGGEATLVARPSERCSQGLA